MSRNNLSGEFPRFLQDLRYLRLLNLSLNLLAGEVPVKGVFTNATAVHLTGNGHLCGGIGELGLPACTTTTNAARDKGKSLALKLAVPMACIALASIVVWASVVACRRKMAPPKVANPLEVEELHWKVSYAPLSNATNGFSADNLIGAGSHGSVYRGTMSHEGTECAVAVKVLSLGQRGALATFAAECEALRHARHRDLVRILTVCASVDGRGDEFKALVYGHMPNGSLERWLHQEPRTLTLVQRLNIAVDVASALDYLHTNCEAPIAHCDLKPSNVLLDDDMVARVGDFGLARFLGGADPSGQASSVILKGSIGYIAPEYGMGLQACAGGDAYSYGILLLEMVTGKRPTDTMFLEGLTLTRFVEEACSGGGILSVIDPRLLGDVGGHPPQVERCLVSVARIGISCASELPAERPAMKQVANELGKVRTSLLLMDDLVNSLRDLFSLVFFRHPHTSVLFSSSSHLR
ncbi:probable LRR receptor-like serine/threonine-protein kinase At3g47570 [Triticum dicoccoides]|uniref:probable LRR receptor-like serine/threonine-protein kinase At3g47570 n=1 Tax=Triticum dicoccoides TaxID=85692 RepID=UPI0018905F3F|nr:probable LRR receptor-like serine/threonine-protein kinase At3g47570 [Triticum dicoccoides]XP_037479880.1 probable LRR receptor-like serine/threonine-protein kinase At3g47570 [Triticum dicoccoides]XP_037479881.1 probable LRR receptor-like serine/threonine-protein kinase At3g47570 [Triticum dicoccoides]XP_037479882.1 probable LRR receptor-like serine/threonine-protein kinase At3g47570 [Triticum dicoccoides]